MVRGPAGLAARRRGPGIGGQTVVSPPGSRRTESARLPEAAAPARCLWGMAPRAAAGTGVSMKRLPPAPTPTGQPVVSTGMAELKVLATESVQVCRVTPVTEAVPAALS